MASWYLSIYNRYIAKRIISTVMIVVYMSLIVSCDSLDRKQKEFHEPVIEIEQIVLNDYSEVLSFAEPKIDVFSISIEWNVFFLRRYVRNDSLRDSLSPYRVMEDVRERVNRFLMDNPDHILNDYNVDIVFWEPDPKRSGQDITQSIGHIYNYSFLPNGNKYDSFSVIEFYLYDDWDCIKGQEDIYEINLGTTSLDETLGIIDSLPNLNTVYVSNEIRDEISELRPNIVFY